MSLRRIGVAAACAAAILPAACGFNSSPADGLTFQPPRDWRPSPGIMGFMQFWRAPNNDREVLMLFKSPKPLRSTEVFSNNQLQDTLKDVTVVRRGAITICGSQPAEYVQARGSSSKGGDEDVDVVLTTTHGTSYFAMYVRPLAEAPNPDAAAAIRELCPK